MIRVVVDDLGFLPADAIVRPSTTRLDPTAAALRRLETMGGTEFHDRLRLSRELAVGAAVVTAAGGELPAEFVIHAVIRSDTEPVSRGGVARAWLSALHQAQQWQLAHLSVPPIGTGAGNLTIEDAAEVMVTVLHAHLGNAAFPTDVSFVVETPADREVFEAALRRITAV
ncbi:MAG TPA: macro domain-containing protein [Gemmatimonadales bacterium]|nr:macro domain-containing protein [Gemmatimonadales bacterium]